MCNVIYCDSDNPANFYSSKIIPLLKVRPLCCIFCFYEEISTAGAFFFPETEAPYLVKELPKGLVALPLVADFSCRDTASAGADVRRAVLLACVI